MFLTNKTHLVLISEQKKCTGSRVNGLDGGTMTTLNNTKKASLAEKKKKKKKDNVKDKLFSQ